jgi:5'-nucleotidase
VILRNPENNMPSQIILYVDMDGVVADFEKAMIVHKPDWLLLSDEEKGAVTDEICGGVPDFFLKLDPSAGAIETIIKLSSFYDVYFLSAAMWNVPQSYTEKRLWIEKHFGDKFRKRLILTHRKDLNIGHYLIDDRTTHGAGKFGGEHIHFGSEKFPDWRAVENYLLVKF